MVQGRLGVGLQPIINQQSIKTLGTPKVYIMLPMKLYALGVHDEALGLLRIKLIAIKHQSNKEDKEKPPRRLSPEVAFAGYLQPDDGSRCHVLPPCEVARICKGSVRYRSLCGR